MHTPRLGRGMKKDCRTEREESAPECSRVLTGRGGPWGLFNGKGDEEGRALAEFTFHADPTAVRIDHIFHDLGPQSGAPCLSTDDAFPRQAVTNLRRHPGTG